MAEASLQDRLREHSKAFDGLLSLIPAKMYYGEDTSDQWKKKKQTKAEAKAAKRNKLDPDSELNRNAKEVMDERARNKRKLREMQEPDSAGEEEEDNISLDLDVEKEKPGEGLKKKAPEPESEPEETASKRPKLDVEEKLEKEPSEKAKAKFEKKLAKQKKKEEKEAKQKAKSDKAAIEQPAQDVEGQAADEAPLVPEKKDKQKGKKTKDASIHLSTESDPRPDEDAEMEQIPVPGIADDDEQDARSTSSSTPHSPVFDVAPATSAPSSIEAASTTTSLASAVAPSEKPKHIKIPTDTTALRARLAARIEALRAARKADGSDGKPILTRAELIEERRRKQAQRKAHKKEMRLKAKQEEDLKREEALASARNSPGGGLMSPIIPLPQDDIETSFAFGRVAFGDGTTLSRDLTYEKEAGPSKKKLDPKSALAQVEAKKRRLAELDEEKRKDVLEKETWLAARRKAEGERVRDDEHLLKKAVKRKDKAKAKSEKEWKERKAGVAKGIAERQKKREANLQARRDGKGQKGKKKSGPTKKKARPGFEGSFSVGGGKKR